jgi:hypothetical protein
MLKNLKLFKIFKTDKIKVYSAGSQIDLTGLSLYKDTTLQTEVPVTKILSLISDRNLVTRTPYLEIP